MNININVLDEIINEAKRGEVLKGNYLPLLFNTYEVQNAKLKLIAEIERFYPNIFEPNLIIINRNKLNELLTNYLSLAQSFYKYELDDNKIINPSKHLLYKRLSNMFLSDFDNFDTFFKREIEFITNERLKDFEKGKNLGYVESLCGNLIAVISKESIESSTPFSMQISIERIINNKVYFYDFPCVKIGIYNGIGYIYEILEVEERKIKEDYANDLEYLSELESYQISIKSILRKGIKTNEINYNEIVSLLATISILSERGITYFIYPTVLINKYNGLEISCYKTIAKQTKIYNEASIKNEKTIMDNATSKIATLKKMLNEHDKLLDENNTKMIKSFKYLEELFSDYKVVDYPMKKDTSMHFSIIKNGRKCNNRLLQDINETIHIFGEKERIAKEKDKL